MFCLCLEAEMKWRVTRLSLVDTSKALVTCWRYSGLVHWCSVSSDREPFWKKGESFSLQSLSLPSLLKEPETFEVMRRRNILEPDSEEESVSTWRLQHEGHLVPSECYPHRHLRVQITSLFPFIHSSSIRRHSVTENRSEERKKHERTDLSSGYLLSCVE